MADGKYMYGNPFEKEPSSIIREYRISLPLSVEEYHIAQLYGVAEASKNETGGGEGVEVFKNEPLESVIPGEGSGQVMKSQYTHKIFHLESKVPMLIRKLAPKGALTLHEVAWNAYPYCRTEYYNDYMKGAFHIIIETRHEPGTGEIPNVHHLKQNLLTQRTVDKIDIVNDACDSRDYKEEEDPKLFHSEKSGRGPLKGQEWEKSQNPVMTCYKLYHVLFRWRVVGGQVEKFIMKSVRRLLFNFHRQVFCWIDKWYGMTIEDIRVLEDKTKKELDELRKTGPVRGMKE